MAKRKNALKNEFKAALKEMYDRGKGSKRHLDKKTNETQFKIYSTNTFKTYCKACDKFCEYIAQNHKHIKRMDLAQKYIDEFLLAQKNKSAFTQSTFAAGICKAYGLKYATTTSTKTVQERADIILHIDKRASTHIFKNRGWIEKPDDIDRFNEAVGLRRRELEALRGSDLTKIDDKYYVHVRNGKGGKKRYAEILNQNPVVIKKMATAGENLVFGKIDHDKNIHLSRQEYAMALYKLNERDMNQLSTKEKYICRGDRIGWEFDRKALAYVSANIGHQRIDVIVHHYWR